MYRKICAYYDKWEYVLETLKKLAGKRIRQWRRQAGYSQESLAKAMGTDKSRVSRWETGQHEPKGDYRATLLRLIKASEDEIFGLPKPPPLPKTVADMPVSEFKAALAAAHRDDIKEARNKKEVKPIQEIADRWSDLHRGKQALCMYFATGEKAFLASFSPSTRALLEKIYQSFE